MQRSLAITLGTTVLVLAGSSAVCAAERVEDPAGDALGDAPDIVAVTFSEPEDDARVSVSIQFAQDPPLETDIDTYTDLVWIHLDIDPEAIQTIQFETEDEYDYIIGTAAVQLPMFLESGGMLYDVRTGETHENVVDVEVDGAIVTWTVERALIGDPEVISWAVLTTVQGGEAAEFVFDASPNEGEPWGVYELSRTSG